MKQGTLPVFSETKGGGITYNDLKTLCAEEYQRESPAKIAVLEVLLEDYEKCSFSESFSVLSRIHELALELACLNPLIWDEFSLQVFFDIVIRAKTSNFSSVQTLKKLFEIAKMQGVP